MTIADQTNAHHLDAIERSLHTFPGLYVFRSIGTWDSGVNVHKAIARFDKASTESGRLLAALSMQQELGIDPLDQKATATEVLGSVRAWMDAYTDQFLIRFTGDSLRMLLPDDLVGLQHVLRQLSRRNPNSDQRTSSSDTAKDLHLALKAVESGLDERDWTETPEGDVYDAIEILTHIGAEGAGPAELKELIDVLLPRICFELEELDEMTMLAAAERVRELPELAGQVARGMARPTVATAPPACLGYHTVYGWD